MSQPETRRSLGHTRKAFTKEDVRRMFDCRADGMTDLEIGRRFGVSSNKVVALIGKKSEAPEVFGAR